ncbi:MAG: hypothetical protein RL095_4051 [Verrucomicrobiota bacterium]|jgi:molybdate transport system ATP-binding protein
MILAELHSLCLDLEGERLFDGISWQWRAGENWLICGPNGAGKSLLGRLLAGSVPTRPGQLFLAYDPDRELGLVSFSLLEELLERERHDDNSETTAGGIDPGRSAAAIIGEKGGGDWLRRVGLERAAGTGLRYLSNGEARRSLLGRALAGRPRLLIVDGLFEGLDTAGRRDAWNLLEEAVDAGTSLIVCCRDPAEAPPACTQMLLLNSLKIEACGGRDEVLASPAWAALNKPPPPLPEDLPPQLPSLALLPRGAPLVDLRQLHIAYDGRDIIEGLDWHFSKGQGWSVSGPNGAGKTTLAAVISGDHPQAYANDVSLFGRRRGSGETLWDIRRRIGVVTAELQLEHRVPANALEVAISGFFDSIGIYRSWTSEQENVARAWLGACGVLHLAGEEFLHLSYGERRLVLLARALVKAPDLLILDEPCQGLDAANRRAVLAIVDRVAARTGVSVLHITHDPNERLACITHRLRFVRQEEGWSYQQEVL